MIQFQNMRAIKFSHVNKKLSGKRIISDISFSIEKGEAVGILGPIGSGKTTLLSLASSLLSPDSGKITIYGVPLDSRPLNILEQMNMASSATRLSGYSTVWENLMTFALLYDVPRPREKIQHLANVFAINNLLNSGVKIFRLSAGESAKVNLVKSLLNDPSILLLDEITSHLDSKSKNTVFSYLQSLRRGRQTTILFASQQIADIKRLCQQIIVINKGRICYQGKLLSERKLQSYYA